MLYPQLPFQLSKGG